MTIRKSSYQSILMTVDNLIIAAISYQILTSKYQRVAKILEDIEESQDVR
jgi:hypothetical protein